MAPTYVVGLVICGLIVSVASEFISVQSFVGVSVAALSIMVLVHYLNRSDDPRQIEFPDGEDSDDWPEDAHP